MKVKDCMNKNVTYVMTNSTIAECAKLMSEKHIGCIPVCDTSRKVVGIITDRDIVLRSIACNKEIKDISASDIMTTKVYYCSEEDEINKAEATMSNEQIRRLPVVNRNGEITGIITLGNLCANQYINTNNIGETMENICSCNRKNAE